ncbi:unnamed protein product [Lepeophtheirus salmonis]|uniref:(salmon louse) hypothetical protein n=1 Tax=Lepeophtheirus salmonis TaxID=72036 RepID=A0A7R8GZZ7_LEPSM|nr:unnamed protein product [Lepeophtheirus salmonis]CAF2774439.1 unnamed protein product [Lepeophtheirus salmonis]
MQLHNKSIQLLLFNRLASFKDRTQNKNTHKESVMFFYRPWVRTPSDDVIFNKQINNLGIYNFYRRSWGYGVLLGLTMIGSLILNSSFLMSFWTWPNQRKHAPSIVLLMFTIRDLFVTIFLIPTAIAWLVFGEGKWISGRKLTKYYDDFFDPALDEEDDHRKVDEYIQSIPTLSVPGVTVVGVGSPNGSRAPSTLREGKRRLTPGGGFHHSNKAASISGGSVQRGANYLKPPLHNFRASSPLKEEIASCPSIRTREMVDMDDEDELGPPTFHQWHYFLTGTTWIIALSFGISAAFYMKYFQNKRTCMLFANPFSNPNVMMDPGFNYLFSNVILTYLVPMGVFLILLVFMYLQRTKNSKFQRYIKLTLAIFLVFVISRTPMDKLQLEGLIEAYNGTKLLTILPYEIEHEILVIWAMFIPTLLHPIIFLGFISEYREGASIGWKIIVGCYHVKKQPKRANMMNQMDRIEEEEPVKNDNDESMTKESEFL